MDDGFGDMPGAGWLNASSPGYNGSVAFLSAGSFIRRTSLASCSSPASSSSSDDFEIGSRLRRQLSLNFFAEPANAGSDWRLWFVPIIRHTDYLDERTIVQAVEHEVAPEGNVLPGRRDIFVISAPGAPTPDFSAIVAPDLEVHDLVQVFTDLRGRNRSVTYAGKYTGSVLRYDAQPGSNAVNIQLDPTLIHNVIGGVQRDLGRIVTYAGFRNRPA